MTKYLRQSWSGSKTFRVILVITLVYVALRLVIQSVYIVALSWIGEGAGTIPNDLQDYLDGATRLHLRQDLYPKGKLEHVEFYQYAPSYALVFIPFLWLSPMTVTIIHTLLHIVAYGLLYIRWEQLFRRWKLGTASKLLAVMLPVWLLFSAFWDDLGYLNIYIIMALLSTFLIEAVLEERLGWAIVWLSIMLQVKPQWAFAAAVPLLLGRYRFFAKLLAAAIVAYIAITGATLLVVGPSYGWQQYLNYFQFLLSMPANFPWRGPGAPFLGYNHSIKQTVFYLLGTTPNAMLLATLVKLLILAPLAAVSLRHLLRPLGRPGHTVPQLGLDMAFALYLGAFIWLDMVWEVSLGIVVFIYLLATLAQRNTKILIYAVFLPYALLDPWRIISFILSMVGLDTVAPGPYILTDPYIYAPLIMVIIVIFYALLVMRLWNAKLDPATTLAQTVG
ncbi:MAG: DUF2029 domain-containing protein [Thermoflexales bacterium]|nr:DUF2029 domain-containing protein [Thermoflexales bacterium]